MTFVIIIIIIINSSESVLSLNRAKWQFLSLWNGWNSL